ncbi:hypothetical protein UlMin_039418 [Ulmus minor]
MDPLTLISSLLPFVIFFIYYFQKRKLCTAPEAKGAWPVIGHLHLFGKHQLTHKTLGALADKHGPVFTIKLGSHRALVVNNWEVAREIFTIHDKAFSNRPSIAASNLLGYKYAMFGFAPYGSYWREMRKIATVELLSNHRIDMLKHIRESEVKTMMKELYDFCKVKNSDGNGALVDMIKWFGDLTHNISLGMVGGKRCFATNADFEEEEGRKRRKVMRDFVHLFGVFVLSDAIPCLGWLDFNGYRKAMKKTAEELDGLIEGWLEEHKKKRLFGGKEKEQDFMDVMLNILEDADIAGYDADTINKATCLNLILAGSDTTMVTLTWALSLLLNNPQKLKKAQLELDSKVGQSKWVNESDIQSLPYLQSVIKETLRLYPPSPIIGLRSTMEPCTLSVGHYVPTDTRLLINAWKIQRDERVWPNASAFEPERFLMKEVDSGGRDFEMVVFGGGRRACPGAALALRMVQFALGRFLQGFEVGKIGSGDVDMTESSGLTNLKATPLWVFVRPRLDNELYG